eukprot:TRINITY_DN18005_c0_g1::TRINITY_DN18005_c0_g1_i1::g.11440::m.11440 TRINITY_DN18005_c0_g1::TRINITY_DN18005_c0_g1_i1::g.11440  ORF type:complete len:191 (+),score=11.23,TPR_11/PF13414.1/0.24,TPR_11/PF13414.1/5.9e-06,TPR_11/PF13414.1/0.012,TPR_12/PF13424.1/5.8,TPR_12/PF13424.1/7.4e-05,TPR_12/PF13424.1/0.011,TPR_19/PF14559.1/73,TPR_19/PF14559.1/5.7e-06,TPR_19/PF14559.1/2.6e+03,TPR_16/PF13432.1/0.13,TPR_16/PF13432.1/0.00011,TPR_2/PF07719.12/1.2e+03,TPR_2/PF07719.12/20,TPR_2/PF07719.12/0.00074,TPR_2/PF
MSSCLLPLFSLVFCLSILQSSCLSGAELVYACYDAVGVADYTEAESVCLEAYRVYGRSAGVSSAIAQIKLHQGSPDALTLLQEAVALRPDYGQYRINLGGYLVNLGRWDEAFHQLQRAVELMPNGTEALNFLESAHRYHERKVLIPELMQSGLWTPRRSSLLTLQLASSQCDAYPDF